MIGVLVASKKEWDVLLDVYNITEESLEKYPYGEFYRTIFQNKEILFYRSGVRKTLASSATQYMIDKFSLNKVIVIGTCSAVNESYDYADVLIPSRIVDYDSIIREIEFTVNEGNYIELGEVDISLDYFDCYLGTSDKELVLWKDYTYLASVGVDASDTESYAVAKICKTNNIKFNVIKGVTDRPMKGEFGTNEQLEVYDENVPIVMKKIIEDYLPEVL